MKHLSAMLAPLALGLFFGFSMVFLNYATPEPQTQPPHEPEPAPPDYPSSRYLAALTLKPP